MIIREPRNKSNYTAVSNEPINDENMPFDELGLWLYMLSKPDHWEFHNSQLQRRGGIGRDKLYRMLKGLKDRGLLERKQPQVNGTFGKAYYIIRETPAPRPGFPDTAEPDTAEPDTANPDALVKTDKQEDLKGSKASAATNGHAPIDADFEATFEAWWLIYPRHVAKQASRRLYAKVREGGITADALAAGARSYAKAMEGTEPQYIAHPSTWLRDGRWEDERADAEPQNTIWLPADDPHREAIAAQRGGLPPPLPHASRGGALGNYITIGEGCA